ncbi:MAG: BON domain-containing protein [Thermosynechococcaceae cyanobacterium]
MKKIAIALLGTALLFSTTACSEKQTSADAPDGNENPPALSADQQDAASNDATSKIRKDQLESDIRAREQRNNAANDGAAEGRTDIDLASEVRSKLEANLPDSALTVESKDGAISVKGTVTTQDQYDKIEKLAEEIKGVQSVTIQAAVSSAQP